MSRILSKRQANERGAIQASYLILFISLIIAAIFFIASFSSDDPSAIGAGLGFFYMLPVIFICLVVTLVISMRRTTASFRSSAKATRVDLVMLAVSSLIILLIFGLMVSSGIKKHVKQSDCDKKEASGQYVTIEQAGNRSWRSTECSDLVQTF